MLVYIVAAILLYALVGTLISAHAVKARRDRHRRGITRHHIGRYSYVDIDDGEGE